MLKFLKILFGVTRKPSASTKMLKLFLEGSSKRSVNRKEGIRESEWLKRRSPDFARSAPAGFVTLSGASDVSVAGTSFRLENCKTLISALNGKRADPASIVLERESDNPEDPNAVSVTAKLGHRDCQIGYLPRDVADRIAHEFSADMPMKAALKEWGQRKSGDAVYFRLSVFVPNAKDRKKFSRKSREEP